MRAWATVSICWLALIRLVSAAMAAEPASGAPTLDHPLRYRTGGGNLVTHEAGKGTAGMIAALKGIGARLARMDSYGWRDAERRPTPRDFDAAMLEAHRSGITPVILLEYEGSYQHLDPPQPIGSYDDWRAAGIAYAHRFRPNGEWAREHGIRDWGATVFAAINEPDVQATIPHAAYRDALAGLADGVLSVDRTLRVVPGGFATCNSHGDATLRGYGTAIADLLQDGRLDGIDLHTYYNARWFPMTKGRHYSAQSCFDRVKRALGITRDIGFYATEFNVAREGDWEDPKLAARLFLTGFWDHFGVVGNDGRTPVTVLAFPWNLADTGRIEGPQFAMAAGEGPWVPGPRGEVMRMLMQLAGDMRVVASDPHGAGTLLLEGPGRQVHVWHNLAGWTIRPGTEWTVELPAWARTAELWGWDGLRRRLPIRAGKTTADALPGNETYMLLVR